jgi:drug/metabolite transporter (DMT)-like permease
MADATRYRILLFAAAFLFSTGGAAIKACSLTSWQVACFRSGVAAAALWIMLPNGRRGWTWRTLLSGAAYAATLVLFALANKLTTSANAIYLQATGPLYMLFLGPLVLREAVKRVDGLVMAVVMAGALLLFTGTDPAGATATAPARGNVLAAFSGLTWALTITSLRWLEKRQSGVESAGATVIAGNVLACAACLPMALPVTRISGADALVIGYLGIFQIGVAYVALTRSIRHVPGLEAATLLLVEPVFNPVWTWIVHGEHPGSAAVAGGALIILATFIGTYWHARTPRTAIVSSVSD